MLRFISGVLRIGTIGVAIVVGLAVWYAMRPLPNDGRTIDVEVSKGSSMREVAQQVASQGVSVHPLALTWLARLSGRSRSMKAGNYRIEPGITPWRLIELLSSGSTSYSEVAFIEGWTFRRMRVTLDAQPDLRHDTLGLSDAEIMDKLGMPGVMPEGQFFPDTYFFSRGTSDLDVLRRALGQMQKYLAIEWNQRAQDLPLNTPQEALTLASVVEKETGKPDDRLNIASVFINRLKAGIPLQSDPTVIYGMGEAFDGNLKKRDLQTDTPYNTYLRRGLPPTPIAMPGRAALHAVLGPAKTDYYYFVARGDGSSVFSRTLDEHNRAVAHYQKGGLR